METFFPLFIFGMCCYAFGVFMGYKVLAGK